jgi:hypothetical protein
VHGDERVQAGTSPSAHDDILVVEGLLVPDYRRIVLRVGGSIRPRPVHGAGGGDQYVFVEVDDPVPVVVVWEFPGLVPEVVEPSVPVEPDCVAEPDALEDCPVPVVADDVVDRCVDVVVVAEPSVGSARPVPALAPSGVAPPPLVTTDVPPVACDFSLIGRVVVVVEVVTVVGTVADGFVVATGVI